MKAYERFLKYVSVWTTSDETSEKVPSADRELVLAELLVEEMKELGIEDARVDEKGYVYGSVPATLGCENAPALGLIAHMDTAPDFSGEGVTALDAGRPLFVRKPDAAFNLANFMRTHLYSALAT